MCMCVTLCEYMCIMCQQDSLELELQVLMSYLVGIGSWMQVPCKNTRCSKPQDYLSNQMKYIKKKEFNSSPPPATLSYSDQIRTPLKVCSIIMHTSAQRASPHCSFPDYKYALWRHYNAGQKILASSKSCDQESQQQQCISNKLSGSVRVLNAFST